VQCLRQLKEILDLGLITTEEFDSVKQRILNQLASTQDFVLRSEYENTVQGLKRTISEKDKTIDEKDKTINEKDKTINEKDKTINEKDKTIDEKDKTIIQLQEVDLVLSFKPVTFGNVLRNTKNLTLKGITKPEVVRQRWKQQRQDLEKAPLQRIQLYKRKFLTPKNT